jgi:hypothetical protein
MDRPSKNKPDTYITGSAISGTGEDIISGVEIRHRYRNHYVIRPPEAQTENIKPNKGNLKMCCFSCIKLFLIVLALIVSFSIILIILLATGIFGTYI